MLLVASRSPGRYFRVKDCVTGACSGSFCVGSWGAFRRGRFAALNFGVAAAPSFADAGIDADLVKLKDFATDVCCCDSGTRRPSIRVCSSRVAFAACNSLSLKYVLSPGAN